MACQVIHPWTFNGLVVAFLDLAIAYFLLCASAVSFFTSKLLGLFGLCLPCPCDGLFGLPQKNYCLQRQLVDGPSEKISRVQLEVKSQFPFDLLWDEDPNFCPKWKLANEANHENGHLEFEGEASCSSFSERWTDLVGRNLVAENEQSAEFGAVNLESGKEQCSDRKGKKVVSRRSSFNLRRRRKGGSIDYGRQLSFSSYEGLDADTQDISISSSSINKMEKEVIEVPVNSGDGMEVPTNIVFPGRVSHLELNEPVGENKPMKKDAPPVEDCGGNARQKLGFDSNETTTIRVLEQALEEEHAARTALYLDLEKERSAAATAADEAMAMILRLQEEKASIEMEARQYQRMIEEKSAYDAEEMNILKEILVRREREKHFLEKEVEEYRQMFFGNDQVDFDMYDVGATRVQETTLHSSEDQVLWRASESISEKPKLKMTNSSPDYEVPSTEIQNLTLSFGKELPILDVEEDRTFIPYDSDNLYKHGNNQDQGREDPPSSMFDTEPRVHDVHVIDNKSHLCNEVSSEKSEQLSMNTTLDISGKRDISTMTGLETERKMQRVSSDTDSELRTMDISQGKGLPYSMRRNSMSAVDYERSKIENEVEWLRERLRIVQEGRENLNFSVRHRERERIQLQLLEDIANQLREIRQLTEPRKAESQASLLPPTSKVMSKKRRWRNLPLRVQRST